MFIFIINFNFFLYYTKIVINKMVLLDCYNCYFFKIVRPSYSLVYTLEYLNKTLFSFFSLSLQKRNFIKASTFSYRSLIYFFHLFLVSSEFFRSSRYFFYLLARISYTSLILAYRKYIPLCLKRNSKLAYSSFNKFLCCSH